MITVNVWLSKRVDSQKNVGHASMDVSGTYISWWPDEAAGLTGQFNPIRNKSYASDIRDEGGQPDARIQLTGLDEAAILQWWSSFGLVRGGELLQGPLPAYSLTQQNCSTVVAKGLKIGGADQYATRYAAFSIVWRPATILEFARSIQQGLTAKAKK